MEETENLGFARLDHDRARRKGAVETIFCQGKTPGQVAAIFERFAAHDGCAFGTRASEEQYHAVLERAPSAQYNALGRVIYLNREKRFTDVGIAGLHRLLSVIEDIRACNAVIAIAGMEGALPSVIAGLVDKPVIAVPTSVGYGASFQGLAPLLTMLNSCAEGITVVNIDNGFGAGYSAAQINRLICGA